MALGATRSSVFRLVVGHGLRLTLIGAAIGIAAAFGIAKALSSILFGVEAHDPVTLAGATAVLLLSATAACLIPALRATRVDPVRALKYE